MILFIEFLSEENLLDFLGLPSFSSRSLEVLFIGGEFSLFVDML